MKLSYRWKMRWWKLGLFAAFMLGECWTWRWFYHVAHTTLPWHHHLWWWPFVTLLNIAGALIFMSGFLPAKRPDSFRVVSPIDDMLLENDYQDDALREKRRASTSIEPIYKRHL